VARGRKAAHVDAYLGYDYLCREGADARKGAQHFDGGAKGFDVRAHLLVDAGDGRIEAVNLIQMQLEQKLWCLNAVA
jgi:hypothetical protein